MAENDPPETGSFYQLLFSDPMATLNDNKAVLNGSHDYSESLYGSNPPKMLCFGGYKEEEEAICSEIIGATAATMKQISDSSSASSANNRAKRNPNRKRNGSGQNPVNGGLAESNKRDRLEKTQHAKPRARARPVRKEKIGDRIATLQQLVSPFGKTDTASVLHEAMCYIKFLQDQVQLLCSPYLHQPSSSIQVSVAVGLRNRGLCLVPVACTAQVASTNGADFWAPAPAAAAAMDSNSIVNCSFVSSKQ